MTQLMTMIARIKDRIELAQEDGQALAEYGLILALIAVVAVAALTALGLAVSGQLDEVTSAFG